MALTSDSARALYGGEKTPKKVGRKLRKRTIKDADNSTKEKKI